MPRACVIVLDAVGAGELQDAADYGDEGSNTLANVAEAVGGLDLPNLEQLGLGNIEELAGCPPQPRALPPARGACGPCHAWSRGSPWSCSAIYPAALPDVPSCGQLWGKFR